MADIEEEIPIPTAAELDALRQQIVLKTSHEWYHNATDCDTATNPYIVIHNADGWRDLHGDGCVQAKYWYHVPITHAEFMDRNTQCTIRKLGPGETVANMPDPYARPYDETHLAYIWRASRVVRETCNRVCGEGSEAQKACRQGHDMAVNAFCEQESPYDDWDMMLAYNVAKTTTIK